MELIDTDALLRHYEDTYSSRFRWLGGPEGMEPDWPERMIYRYGLLGTAEAFGEMQLAGGFVGLRGIYGQPLNWFPKCDGVNIPQEISQLISGNRKDQVIVSERNGEADIQLIAIRLQNVDRILQNLILQDVFGNTERLRPVSHFNVITKGQRIRNLIVGKKLAVNIIDISSDGIDLNSLL